MASLTGIKARAAAYLQCTVSDFTVSGTDLFLPAVNQVRRLAEMNWDFEFSWARFSLSVNFVTGASLGDAVLVLGGTPGCRIKTVLDIGVLDSTSNLVPLEWTTMDESANRQRGTNPGYYIPFPSESQIQGGPCGRRRLILNGDRVTVWPIAEENANESVTVYIDAYTLHPGWTSLTQETSIVSASGATGGFTGYNGDYTAIGERNDNSIYARVDGSNALFLLYSGTQWVTTDGPTFPVQQADSFELTASSTVGPAGTYANQGTATGTFVVTGGEAQTPWLSMAEQFLLWGVIVDLNFLRKEFVPRTEGNLSPPTVMRDEALETFKQWDTAKYQQRRRHGRT